MGPYLCPVCAAPANIAPGECGECPECAYPIDRTAEVSSALVPVVPDKPPASVAASIHPAAPQPGGIRHNRPDSKLDRIHKKR